MSARDRIGLIVIILLFVVFCLALVTVFRDAPDTVRDPSESVIVQQRIQNLQKNR